MFLLYEQEYDVWSFTRGGSLLFWIWGGLYSTVLHCTRTRRPMKTGGGAGTLHVLFCFVCLFYVASLTKIYILCPMFSLLG